MQGKQLELLKEAVLRLTRVAFLGGAPGSPEYGGYVAAMEAGARSLDLRLQVVNIAKPGEYDAAFRAVAAERAEAVTVAGNSRNLVNRKRIHDFTARNRLPAA